MAFLYDICIVDDTGFSVTGNSNNGITTVDHKAKQTFNVIVDEASVSSAREVSVVQIGCLAEVPEVNVTSYYDSVSGVGMPFAVCRNVTVTRNRQNRYLFNVTADYSTGPVEERQCVAAPPTNLTDITPQVSSVIGSYQRVLYTDKNGNQCWRMPFTGTPFDVPVAETIPTLQLNIVQFESAITFDQQMERSFKLNDATYRSKAAGLWMIGAVQAENATVQLAAGPTTCAKVTYPIILSERFYYPPGVAATPANAIVYGHDHIQPLVDTMKIDGAGKVVPIEKDGTAVMGYINASDGTQRIPAVAGGNEDRPDYLRFRDTDVIDFSSFLQV